MSADWVYVPIMCLKKKHPYTITGFSERDGHIVKTLKDRGDPREIKSLLTRRCFYPHFKLSWELNKQMNGEEATTKLKFYGCKPTDTGGTIVVRISGERLTAILM